MSKQTIDRSRKSVVVIPKPSENKIIILSSKDNLDLPEVLVGHNLNLSSQDLYIFAESVTLGEVKAKNLVMYANKLYTTDSITLDVSGADGDKNGQNGQNAGNVFLYVEDISSHTKTNEWFNIRAIGGNGGEGNNGVGGNQNGGNGGNGGNVRLSMVHPYKMSLNKLSKMLRNEVVEKKQITELIKIINSAPSAKESVAISDCIKKLNDMLSIDRITIQESCLLDLYIVINALTTKWENQNAYISVQEGNYGVHGTQGGKNGSSGNPGTIKCELVESNSCILTPYIRFSTPHLDQLSMVLDRAKMQYAFLGTMTNGELNKKWLSNIFDLLHKVKTRTESYIKLNDNLEIEPIDDHPESAIKVLNTEASNYLTQLQKGLDYFAYPSDYVPVISLQFMQKSLKDLCDNFTIIDNAYEKLLIQNNTLEEKKENTKMMLSAIESKINQCQSQINSLDEQYIPESGNLILDYQNLLSQKKGSLDKVMDQYDKLIKDYISNLKKHNFDFNIKSLLGCLSMVAFAPESKAMLITQTAEFIEEGVSNTTTASGERVNKDYLIRKLTVEEANLKSLSDNFTKGNTVLDVDATGLIKLDEKSNNMIIVKEEQALFGQLDEFYKILPQGIDSIDDIKKSIKDYVNIVTQRNTEILHYNDYVALLSKAINNKQILENQSSSIQNEMLKDLNSESSGLEKFVSDAYYTMRDNILHTLNWVERAYKLWAIDNQDVFTSQIFKNGVIDLNKEVLSVIQEQLVKKILDYRIQHPTIGGQFKESYFMNSDTDDDMLNDLRENKVLILKIKHDDPKASKLDYLEGIARISCVYPYIHGIKYIDKENNNTLLDGELRGKITHGREENFKALVNFSHNPITKNFGYNLKKPTYEYSKSCVTEVANFEVPGADEQVSYPILSPFTEWTIKIAPDDRVDLSGITSLELVFEGLYFT